jgi:DNA-binding CsgD family transcriptional regulator
MRSHLDKVDELVHGFYEAAAVPALWSRTLEKASNIFGADGSCIIAFPSSTIGAVWSPRLDELAHAFFDGGWHINNERLARALPLRHARPVMTESDIFTPEELDRHPFNAEFINVHGYRWGAGCFLGDVDGWTTAFTVERLAKRERFGPAETEAIQSILPHMRNAAQVASHLALAQGQGMLDAFEKLGCAAILIGCTGKVNRYNEQTKPYLGRELCILQGCLTSCHKASNDALQRVIAGVLGAPTTPPAHRQTVAAISRRDGSGRPFFALGMPITGAAEDVFQHAKAMVLLVDPDAQVSPPELLLRHGFALTPAEIRLALAMTRGATLSEYAEAQGITVGTARIQLKAVMGKTDTHRQADLVALLARLAQVPTQDKE